MTDIMNDASEDDDDRRRLADSDIKEVIDVDEIKRERSWLKKEMERVHKEK